MSGQAALATVLLLVAAVAVGWPVRAGRIRRRAVLGPAPRSGAGPMPAAPDRPGPRIGGGRPAGRPMTVSPRRGGHAPDRPRPTRPPGRRDPTHPFATLGGIASERSAGRLLAAVRRLRRRCGAALPSRRVLLLAAVLGGVAGAVVGGPVAGAVLAAYGTLAARGVRRRHARRLAGRAQQRDLDQLCALAADLRAGLPVGNALGEGPGRIARLARAAVRLADRTGAPLAELLERVESDARAAERGLAAAAAQAAGARATAWLLAALPLGGIGLGYAIGVDPLDVLLHTPIGAGSALAAVALQVGGLLWAERLGAVPGRTG